MNDDENLYDLVLRHQQLFYIVITIKSKFYWYLLLLETNDSK